MYLLRHRHGHQARGARLVRQQSLQVGPSSPQVPRSPSLPSDLSRQPPRRQRTQDEESRHFEDYMRSVKLALTVLVLVCLCIALYSLSYNPKLRANINRLWGSGG